MRTHLGKWAARSAVDAGLNVSTRGVELGLLEDGLLFEQPQAITDAFARALIATGVDLLPDESLEMAS